jgi:CheY-like chemotaxis protein
MPSLLNHLRILIADDHAVTRAGLRNLLSSRPGWHVCAEAATGREAVALAEQHRPDIIVMDIVMPELSGLEATRRIRRLLPKTEVLVLSLHYSDQLAREVIESGARAYVLKSDASKELLRAIRAVSNHQPFYAAGQRGFDQGCLRSKSGSTVFGLDLQNSYRAREGNSSITGRGADLQRSCRRARDQCEDGRNPPYECYAEAGNAFGQRIGTPCGKTSHDRAVKMGKRVFRYWSALCQFRVLRVACVL